MEVLKFIFVLGINFSIFGFIWAIIMMFVRSFQNPSQPKKESVTYVLRIIKYFLLVSVTANYIVMYENSALGSAGVSMAHMIIGSAVLGLYLLGKLQNRAMMSQMANNPLLSRFISKVDPKMEKFLIIGSIIYFMVCLMNPYMVNNGLINWFTNAIISIYDTPVIGWIFSIIAFFFLISIIMRGANVIGRLLNGEDITQKPQGNGGFQFNAGGMPFGNTQESHEKDSYEDENGFTDYEDVTDEEEEKDS
jgi:hypothetical protein